MYAYICYVRMGFSFFIQGINFSFLYFIVVTVTECNQNVNFGKLSLPFRAKSYSGKFQNKRNAFNWFVMSVSRKTFSRIIIICTVNGKHFIIRTLHTNEFRNFLPFSMCQTTGFLLAVDLVVVVVVVLFSLMDPCI